MNRQEAASIVAYLNRAGLLGAMEGQAAVWADALEDVPALTAQLVVRDMARTRTSVQRWVTPGDVAAAVADIRKANLARIGTPPAPPESIDPDDTAKQLTWTRAWIAAKGDGHEDAQADGIACTAVGVTRPVAVIAPRPVAALVEQAARTTRIPRKAS